jgi:hypothetical protein
VSLAQQFIVANVLGAVLFTSLGYVAATHFRHKRSDLLVHVIRLRLDRMKMQGRPFDLREIFAAIYEMDQIPERSVWMSFATRVAIYAEEEAPPADTSTDDVSD